MHGGMRHNKLTSYLELAHLNAEILTDNLTSIADALYGIADA
jgi:hypothetical protein